MTLTVWNVVRGLVGLESGCRCRRCAEPILAGDPYGMSEGVCRPCRG